MSSVICRSFCKIILATFENRAPRHQTSFVLPRGRGSVLLWRRCDTTLCTSGFADDVVVAHMGHVDTVAASGVIASSCAG